MVTLIPAHVNKNQFALCPSSVGGNIRRHAPCFVHRQNLCDVGLRLRLPPIDVGKRLPGGIDHLIAARDLLGDPRTGEAAGHSYRFGDLDRASASVSRFALASGQNIRLMRIQALVRSAVGRLSSDLLGLQRILDRFSPKPLKGEVRIVRAPKDRCFEHLILDILNEDDRRARVAPLEDFLEKTDFRVKYPGLERRRGARVQVTSIVAPELHETKVEAIRLAEEFVFLSPLSLAELVSSLQAHAPASSLPGTSSFALAPLWDCLEGKPIDVPELACELKRIMFRALTGMPDSPLGPMVKVPLPIRQLIRLFVETHAMASTSKLREREGGCSSALTSHVG